MRTHRISSAVLVAVFGLAAFVGPAYAAFSAPELKCRDTIAKNGSKLAKKAAKELSKCHKQRSRGKLPPETDCNSIAAVDSKGRIDKVGDKLISAVVAKCAAASPAALLYSECPSPCNGQVPSIGSFQDVAECVRCVVESSVEFMTSNGQGDPATPMESGDAKCHDAIGKNQTKLFDTVVKERVKCQKVAEKGGAMDLATCEGADPKGKIAKTRAKSESNFDKSCQDADVGNLGSCSDLILANVKGCSFNTAASRGGLVFRSFYELNNFGGTTTTTFVTTTTGGPTTTTTLGGVQDPQCPDRGELTLLSGTGPTCIDNADCIAGTCDSGLGRCVTVTELDTGWTGIAHDADINDLVVTNGRLLCPGPAPTCGECTVLGIFADTDNCRCANDNRAICDQPFVADNDDCGGQICNCYFGTPLPLSAGNTPACVVNRFSQDISGTANVDTGDGQLNVSLRSIVYTGDLLWMPCPACGGTCTAGKPGTQTCGQDIDCDTSVGAGDGVCGNLDPTPNDGLRGGTCHLGENAGQSCDVRSLHTTFPAPQGGGYSLDCFPASGKNVSGLGLSIKLNQTTGPVSLPANVICGFPPFLVENCHCGLCTGNTSIACASNADCGGAGSCERRVDGDPRANQCDNGDACQDAGGGEGVCPAGPADKSCDAVLRANGEGFISCNNNADCLGSNIGIEAGNCTISKPRECFLDPITATGVADPETPVGAATFCIPTTSNGAINSVAGLPGPGRVVNQAASRLFCASDPGVQYQPGVGGCP